MDDPSTRKFIARRAVEALAIRALLWRRLLDEHLLDIPAFEPVGEGLGDELPTAMRKEQARLAVALDHDCTCVNVTTRHRVPHEPTISQPC